EDGIRDFHVTGVQTCALPIFSELAQKLNVPIIELFDEKSSYYRDNVAGREMDDHDLLTILKEEADCLKTPIMVYADKAVFLESRSEERRVGKECRGRGSAAQ